MFDLPKDMSSIIKVIGVGGGGSNAVNYMYDQGIRGVDFVVCNTDRQALDISPVPYKIQLGKALTEGRGAGMIPEVGMNAAFENIDELRELLSKDTKMVFVTAGMGGGTGTGAAPVIAQIARELGILTVGIVTIPFDFEGRKRKAQAEEGLERMRNNVDTLLVINNEKLRIIGKNLSLSQAFGQADNILSVAAKGIAEVISVTGLINVDFNDVNTVLRNSGHAIMGSAVGSGESRAIDAVKSALNSPLLNEDDIHGAQYVLLNITYGDKEVMMDEIIEITDFIQDAAGATADVIWGHGHDESLGDQLSITVIATGFSIASSSSNVLTERKVINLNEEKKIEITSPLESPFQSPERITEVLNQAPYLKSDLKEDSEFDAKPTQEPLKAEESTEKVTFHLKDDSSSLLNQDQTTTEWNVSNDVVNNQSQDLFNATEEPVAQAEPEIIRHFINDEQQKQESLKIQSTVHPSELIRRNEERLSKITDITSKIQNADDITEFESEPAYLRRNIQVNDEKPSAESPVSRFGLSNNSNGDTTLGNNSFLHDNVD